MNDHITLKAIIQEGQYKERNSVMPEQTSPQSDNESAIHDSSTSQDAEDWELDTTAEWKRSEKKTETNTLLRQMEIDLRGSLNTPDRMDKDYNVYGFGLNGDMFW